jgi:cyclopropane fatty-acyl-phospholipid synthase-like methyltransferase
LDEFLRNINMNTVSAARALLAHYDFSAIKTLVDVGSGGGGLAITITKACPHIKATAIDLPQVVPIAEKIVEEQSAADRVKVIGADLLSGPLPGSYDVAVLRGFLQVFFSADARLALTHIAAAVNSGGKIYIIGQILDDLHTSPLEAVGFNLTFINMFEAGESHTESERRDWLSAAGFIEIKRENFLFPDGSGVMTGSKSITNH